MKVIDRLATGVERVLVGETWAMRRGTFGDRVWYFRTSGRWPEGKDSFWEEMRAQADIEATTNSVCEEVKIGAARRLGLRVKPKRRI